MTHPTPTPPNPSAAERAAGQPVALAEAIRDGYQAARDGAPIYDNPCNPHRPRHSPLWNAWRAGWWEAIHAMNRDNIEPTNTWGANRCHAKSR